MIAVHQGVSIQLPQFEGPLPLLLYLIKKEEMDIFNISILEITRQYLEYMKYMKDFNLEVSGEFIAMAATLIHIKSRMLLPQYNDQGEIIEQDDPRKELVQKLIEYQKFQEAAKSLYERPLVGRDIWVRGIREKWEEKEEEVELEENALFSLITAYRKAIYLANKKIHKVAAKVQSIAGRILEIKDRLVVGRQVGLHELITDIENKRKQVLITFLVALELAKLGLVRLFQADTYQEIYLQATDVISPESISRVEEYEHIEKDNLSNIVPPPHEELDFESEFESQTEPESFFLENEVDATELVPEQLSEGVDTLASATSIEDELLLAEKELGLESAVDESDGGLFQNLLMPKIVEVT